jgi:hypothetical protein
VITCKASWTNVFVSARTNKRHHHHHALLPPPRVHPHFLDLVSSLVNLFTVPSSDLSHNCGINTARQALAGHLSVDFSLNEALGMLRVSSIAFQRFLGVTGQKSLFDLFILWNRS